MNRIVPVLCGLLLLTACGGQETSSLDETVNPINAVLAAVTTAVRTGDETVFCNLVEGEPGAWPDLQTFVQENGSLAASILGEPVQLNQHANPAFVSGLHLQVFYDFSSYDDRVDRAFQLRWRFHRPGPAAVWSLREVVAGPTGSDYNNMISDLKRMPAASFAALDMQGVPADGLPDLLARVFRALRSENTDALGRLTVDGALFQARERGVAMPTLDNSRVLGEYNRNLVREAWDHQIRNLQNFSVPLSLTDEELLTLFQTYVPTAFPQAATALRLAMDFSGEGVAENVDSFRLSWTAAFLHGQWLVDELAIDRVEHY